MCMKFPRPIETLRKPSTLWMAIQTVDEHEAGSPLLLARTVAYVGTETHSTFLAPGDVLSKRTVSPSLSTFGYRDSQSTAGVFALEV